MYSLVLLVKGKQNLFVQRGCSSQESFVGGDPRGHADCNCSQPSGSSLFEISCRESLSAPQESVLLLSSMSVWFNSFSYHPSIFPIHLFKDHLVGAFCEWARSWAGAQWWTQESLCSCWAYCHPSSPSPLVIWAITIGHRLEHSGTLSGSQWDQGPGSLRGDLQDMRSGQPWWALSWALRILIWISLALNFFVRRASLAYPSTPIYAIAPHLLRGLPHAVHQDSSEWGHQPCKTWSLTTDTGFFFYIRGTSKSH